MPIARYFVKEGSAATYEYDFGDDWWHTILFESVETIRKGERPLAWLGGAYDAAAFSASDVTFDDPTVRWRQAFMD